MEPFTLGGIEFTPDALMALFGQAIGAGLAVGVFMVLVTLFYGRRAT